MTRAWREWPIVVLFASMALAWPSIPLGYPQWLLDSIRAMTFVEAIVVLVAAVLIARRYARNWKADPSKARLLPRHVTLLGVGVAMLTMAVSIAMFRLVGDPFIWYVSPLVFPAMTALTVGLWDMVRWLPNRTAPPYNRQRRSDDYPPEPNANLEGT